MRTHTNRKFLVRVGLRPLFFVFAALPSAHADPGFEEFYNDYIANSAKTESAVFVAGCHARSEDAFLFFHAGRRDGLLVEIHGGAIINLATILIKDGKLVVGETHGGAYTYQTTSALATELASKPYRLLLPSQTSGILKTSSETQCKSI